MHGTSNGPIGITPALLANALDTQEIWPALQPVVHLKSRQIAGFELLARWTSPQYGVIPPAIFIPIAEEAGLLNRLLEKLLQDATDAMRSWPKSLTLAVNLSTKQLVDSELPSRLIEILNSKHLDSRQIRFEITESSLISNQEAAQQGIDVLVAAGASLSLDDFGTGYSSLSRLQSLPFSELKVDASFVGKMETDPGCFRIVLAVTGLGLSLGLHVVAEGIETEKQAGFLEHMGCEFGQGFHLGKPMSIQAANQLLAEQGHWHSPQHAIDNSPFLRWHQLETLYKFATVGLCFIDPQLRIVNANRKFAELIGIDDQSLYGKPLQSCLQFPDQIEIFNYLSAVAVETDLQPITYVNCQTGRTCVLSFQVVRSDIGEVLGISGEAIDVTERLAAEKYFADSAEHFKNLAQLSPNIPWAANADGAIDYIGPTLDWDTHKSTSQERHAQWLDRMHPDDLIRVRMTWLAHLPSKQPFETEFRILWQDERYRWVRSRALPSLDEKGAVIRWFGLIVDISHERTV